MSYVIRSILPKKEVFIHSYPRASAFEIVKSKHKTGQFISNRFQIEHEIVLVLREILRNLRLDRSFKSALADGHITLLFFYHVH